MIEGIIPGIFIYYTQIFLFMKSDHFGTWFHPVLFPLTEIELEVKLFVSENKNENKNEK